MKPTQAAGNRRTRPAAGTRHLFEELNREDSELREHLLDAALAGLRLARDPHSRNLRRDAGRIWSVIEPVISHHFAAEDAVMLPWLDRYAHLSPDIRRRARECHDKLKKLAVAVENSDFERVSDVDAAATGRALCGLAVCLDDAIDAEERRLFPAIQKALFEMDRCGR